MSEGWFGSRAMAERTGSQPEATTDPEEQEQRNLLRRKPIDGISVGNPWDFVSSRAPS